MPSASARKAQRHGFGDAAPQMRPFAVLDVDSQQEALLYLAEAAAPDSMDPRVRRAAVKIVRKCKSRDDLCELKALFNAVKYGDPEVDGLEDGLKYMSDHFFVDTFTKPGDVLAECEDGNCAGDCDDHAALVFVLGAALGFRMGLRAWGPKGSHGYQHVYAIALIPKEDETNPTEYGLDTSADAGDEDEAGWQPPAGNVITAWMEAGDIPSNGGR